MFYLQWAIPTIEDTLISVCEFAKNQHTLDEWTEKFIMISLQYGHSSPVTFNIFEFLVTKDLIPRDMLLPLFKHIYTSCNVTKSFESMLKQIVVNETPTEKTHRIKNLTSELSNLLSYDRKIPVYRGEYNNAFSNTDVSSLPLSRAISFTPDISKAKFFACRWLPTTAIVYTFQIPIEEVIFYSNDRNEKEIVILPSKSIKDYIIKKEILKQEPVSQEEYYERFRAWSSS